MKSEKAYKAKPKPNKKNFENSEKRTTNFSENPS